MKERLKEKIDEVINHILDKDVRDMTYSDYKILDAEYKDIVYKEEQAKRNEEFKETFFKAFSGMNSVPGSLPEPTIDD